MNWSKIFKLLGWNYTGLDCSDLLIFEASFSWVFKHKHICKAPAQSFSAYIFPDQVPPNSPLKQSSTSQSLQLSCSHPKNHRIIYVGKTPPRYWLQPLTNYQPVNSTMDGTECHIQSSQEQLQEWWLLHPPEQLIPMLSNPFHEGILPQEGATQECCWLSILEKAIQIEYWLKCTLQPGLFILFCIQLLLLSRQSLLSINGSLLQLKSMAE